MPRDAARHGLTWFDLPSAVREVPGDVSGIGELSDVSGPFRFLSSIGWAVIASCLPMLRCWNLPRGRRFHLRGADAGACHLGFGRRRLECCRRSCRASGAGSSAHLPSCMRNSLAERVAMRLARIPECVDVALVGW